MALSFANVLTILRSRLAEATASVWTDDELQDYIYLAEHELLQLLPSDAFFDIIDVETTTEASASNGYVPLPSTALIQQMIAVELADSPAGAFVRMRIIRPGLSSEYAATEVDPVSWFEDGSLYFEPNASAQIQRVNFKFIPAPTEGAILLPDRFASLIVSFAFALAVGREDISQSATEKNEFYQRVQMLSAGTFGINSLNRGR